MDAEPAAFDTSIAHHARIYDYLLGGKDNYATDYVDADARTSARSWSRPHAPWTSPGQSRRSAC